MAYWDVTIIKYNQETEELKALPWLWVPHIRQIHLPGEGRVKNPLRTSSQHLISVIACHCLDLEPFFRAEQKT